MDNQLRELKSDLKQMEVDALERYLYRLLATYDDRKPNANEYQKGVLRGVQMAIEGFDLLIKGETCEFYTGDRKSAK